MSGAIFTTPPPRRPPPPKQPLFTTKFFSTTSFGPGHVVGAGILVLGLVGFSKFFVSRGHAEGDRARGSPRLRPEDTSKLAEAGNARGHYASRP